VGSEQAGGAHSRVSTSCLGSGFNVYGIAEVDTGQHGSLLILNVDAVMEDYAALIFRYFSKRDPSASHSMRSRSFQIGQLRTLIVRKIDVVMQVEIEPRHRSRSVRRLGSFLFLIWISHMSAIIIDGSNAWARRRNG
jgi:hypothetical protein